MSAAMSIHTESVCLSVCLSLLGCRAITVDHNSLFSLQNSLKKRGSRSLGKTEKKPSVQVLAPEPPGHATVTHQRPRSRCQLETEPRPGVNPGMAAPSPPCRALQSFPAAQSPCIRAGLMCWAILFVLNRSLVSFISGAAVALTLSLCKELFFLCKELKEFGFYVAKLLLLWWLWQPVSLLPAVLEGALGASRGLGEQRVPVGMAGGHITPALPGCWGSTGKGICQWQQDFSCHLLLS